MLIVFLINSFYNTSACVCTTVCSMSFSKKHTKKTPTNTTSNSKNEWQVIFAPDLVTPDNPLEIKWLAEVIDTGSWVKCFQGAVNFKLLDRSDEWVIAQLINLFRSHLYPDTPCYKSVFQIPSSLSTTPPGPPTLAKAGASKSCYSPSDCRTSPGRKRLVHIVNYRNRRELIEWAIEEGHLPPDTNAQEEVKRLEMQDLVKRKAHNRVNIPGGGRGSAWIAEASKSLATSVPKMSRLDQPDIQGCSFWFRVGHNAAAAPNASIPSSMPNRYAQAITDMILYH